MAATGRPRIRVHADLRGLPGSEHLHVVVSRAGGATAGAAGAARAAGTATDALELRLEDAGDGPWTTAPEPTTFCLDAEQHRWASFGVEAYLEPGRRVVFDLVVRGARVHVRRRYLLEEHGGHWRLRAANRILHRRPRAAGPRTLAPETSNTDAR